MLIKLYCLQTKDDVYVNPGHVVIVRPAGNSERRLWGPEVKSYLMGPGMYVPSRLEPEELAQHIGYVRESKHTSEFENASL